MSSADDLHRAHHTVATIIRNKANQDALQAAAYTWAQMSDDEEAALIEYLDGRSSD